MISRGRVGRPHVGSFACVGVCVVLVGLGAAVHAQVPGSVDASGGPPASETVAILKNVGIDRHLNGQLPLDLALVDEQGHDVTLAQFFGQRPVVLVLAYYDCPMLCTLVLNGATTALRTLSFEPGRDFEFVVVSIDPGETPALAGRKKASYLQQYGRPGADVGFHFLTGREAAIQQLAAAVGFRYAYDAAIHQYAHPAVVTVLTPEGRISRYLYGIDFPAADLRLALVEAANGRIGTPVDQALLLCYHYDASSGRYGVAVANLLRAGGLATLIGMLALVVLIRRRRATTFVS